MNNKKRIAVIGVKGFPGFGGAARATEALLLELKEEFDITVYSVSSHTKLSGDYYGLNQITFNSFPFKRLNTFAYYVKSMFHCLFVGNYDLVHVQHIYAGFIIPFLRIKYPVINTVRGLIPKSDNKWNSLDKLIFKSFEYIALRFSNKTVSVCKPHIPYLQSIFKREILYIPNGVYVHPELICTKRPDDYLCFSASRIISLKGLHIFIDALNLINYQGKIKIIGSMEHVQEYKELILKKSAGLNIEFLGLIVDKQELFEIILNAKLFVFPSLNEGMSNMLLEAASLKTPIIASNIEENRYVFEESEVLFFKSENAEDLAIKLKSTIINSNLLAELSENAFNKICLNHNWEKIANDYLTLYNNIARNR